MNETLQTVSSKNNQLEVSSPKKEGVVKKEQKEYVNRIHAKYQTRRDAVEEMIA